MPFPALFHQIHSDVRFDLNFWLCQPGTSVGGGIEARSAISPTNKDECQDKPQLAAHNACRLRTFISVANVVLNPEPGPFFSASLRFRFFRGGLVVLDSLFCTNGTLLSNRSKRKTRNSNLLAVNILYCGVYFFLLRRLILGGEAVAFVYVHLGQHEVHPGAQH